MDIYIQSGRGQPYIQRLHEQQLSLRCRRLTMSAEPPANCFRTITRYPSLFGYMSCMLAHIRINSCAALRIISLYRCAGTQQSHSRHHRYIIKIAIRRISVSMPIFNDCLACIGTIDPVKIIPIWAFKFFSLLRTSGCQQSTQQKNNWFFHVSSRMAIAKYVSQNSTHPKIVPPKRFFAVYLSQVSIATVWRNY